jgi:hypothetical protein
MRSAPYRLIRMAIEMAREAGAYFSVVDCMSCITIAKRPCYAPLKIKQSYNIVHDYVLILFVYYGDPPTAMNAVLAIIADGGQAFVDIDIEDGRNKLISNSLYNFILNPLMTASSNRLRRGFRGVVCLSIKTMPLDEKTAHHGGDVCVMCVLLAKSLPSGSFSFLPERT